ncbi:ubiquitin-like protein [Anaeramoeba flamelloides]|uniref:Ubiquitin-like protein n=1 Tax=Anaeramoeba flamelloides TaxID=1746091 RepID=A0AAV7ZFZ4_9EUKA|nr:ubiquitin-like protein [Anaeramoeba flamelloides]
MNEIKQYSENCRITELENNNLELKTKLNFKQKQIKDLKKYMNQLKQRNEKLFEENSELADQLQQLLNNVGSLGGRTKDPITDESKENSQGKELGYLTNFQLDPKTRNLTEKTELNMNNNSKNNSLKTKRTSKLFSYDQSDEELMEMEQFGNLDSTFNVHKNSYQREMNILFNMGYKDSESILNALIMTNGDISSAISLLK